MRGKEITWRLPSINTVQTMHIPGVIYQENLKWNHHLENVIKLACRRMQVLRRVKRIPDVTKNDLVSVY